MRNTAVILLLGLLLGLLPGVSRAELPGVLHWTLKQDMESTYRSIYKSLENNNMFVIFEADIGRSLAGFAPQWGPIYNRNQWQGPRSMLFGDAWDVNEISKSVPQ